MYSDKKTVSAVTHKQRINRIAMCIIKMIRLPKLSRVYIVLFYFLCMLLTHH